MRCLIVVVVALLAGCSQGVMPEGFKYGEIGTRQEDFLSGLLKDERLKGKKILAELKPEGETIELDRDPTSVQAQLDRLLKSGQGETYLLVGADEVASFEHFEFQVQGGAVISAKFDVGHPTSEVFDKLVAQATKRTGITPKKTSHRGYAKTDNAEFVNCDTLIFYELDYSTSPSPLDPSFTMRSLRLTIFKMDKDSGLWRDDCATGPKL